MPFYDTKKPHQYKYILLYIYTDGEFSMMNYELKTIEDLRMKRPENKKVG